MKKALIIGGVVIVLGILVYCFIVNWQATGAAVGTAATAYIANERRKINKARAEDETKTQTKKEEIENSEGKDLLDHNRDLHS